MKDLKQLEGFVNTLANLRDYYTPSAVQTKPKEKAALHRKTTLSDRLIWLSELKKSESNLSWIWQGYISRNLVTLISAAPKAGKTTLLAHLLAAFESGGDYLGQNIEKTKVLIVTEESKESWRKKRDSTGLLGDNAAIIPRFFCSRRDIDDWRKAIQNLKTLCLQEEIKLVVFDTISYFWLVSDENQATPVNDALRPLHVLTEANIGVVLVHHDRKSGGSGIESSRGSSALTGFVDIVINLKKGEGSKRILKSDGRFSDETPDQITIELAEGEYILVASDANSHEKQDRFDEILPFIPVEGITTQDLLSKLETAGITTLPDRTTLQRWLKKARNKGQVDVIGKDDSLGKPDLWARIVSSEGDESDFENEVKEALF